MWVDRGAARNAADMRADGTIVIVSAQW